MTTFVAVAVAAVVVATVVAAAVATLLLLGAAVSVVVQMGVLCKLHQLLLPAPLECNAPPPDSKVRYSSGSWLGLMVTLFSFRIRIHRHCIEEMRYFSHIAPHASCPSGCCLEADILLKRTRKLLAAHLVHKSRTP